MAEREGRVAAALFILSFGARDALAQAAERAGWRPIAARRAEDAVRRFAGSGAAVAVVDARGAWDEAILAVRALGPVVRTRRAALLALIDEADGARLPLVFEAGATHYLIGRAAQDELGDALRFAWRHAARLAGGDDAAAARAGLSAADGQAWSWRPGARVATLDAPLAARLELGAGPVPLATLLRRLSADGRRAAREAVRRLLHSGRPTAFAHVGARGERIAHHLVLDEQSGHVTGTIEDIDAPDARALPPSRDPLTGLPDRDAAEAWFATRLAAEPGGSGAPRCIALHLAVSRFDRINDAFGRTTGDSLLQGVARRIERMAAGEAPRARLVARLGAAEFVVGLAAPAGLEEARFLAARLAETVARPFVSGEHLVTLAARLGIAAAAAGEDAPAPLLARAAAAALEEGGAVRVRDAAAVVEDAQDSALEVDLRRALDGDEIDIMFQPQVDITTGRTVGVEALARWQHPGLGLLGAATLFAAAERSDYLGALSAHVQRKAAMLVARWEGALASLRVAINVTADDIAQPGFAARFLAMLDTAGLARGRVTVEVTESGLIEELGAAAQLLAALRQAGLRVAIDDFGTGYSSLAYLKALPLDYLKIDRRLSQDIVGSARDRVVVRGVIEMARSLGLAVIAEGVETEEQLAALAGEGCNYYQGFLKAPPLRRPALARLIAREQAGER